jgi:hypothetical protein
LIIALSLFVFLLALNAKLSLYQQSTHANATNSSKLWLNGQKMEAQAPPILVFAVLSFTFALLRPRFRQTPWPRVQFEVPVVTPARTFQLHRFLRPPPVS